MTEAEHDFLEGNTCGPHCDARVLHAPGECRFCDEYPLLQKAREVWGIAFTGRGLDGHAAILCPSDMARGVGGAHTWPGNRPTRPGGPVDVAVPDHLNDYFQPLEPRPVIPGEAELRGVQALAEVGRRHAEAIIRAFRNFARACRR